MIFFQKLGKECDLNQNKVEQLGSVLQQMEPLCNASKERKKFKRLHQQTYEMHAKVKDKLCLLEESQSHLEDYERSMDELTRWMHNAKSHLEMKDTNSSLNEQFTAYEVRFVFQLFCDNISFANKVLKKKY